MNVEIKSFEFENKRLSIRSYVEPKEGKRWYVASDIGRLLSKQPNKAARKVSRDEKSSAYQLNAIGANVKLSNLLLTAEGLIEMIHLYRPSPKVTNVYKFLTGKVLPQHNDDYWAESNSTMSRKSVTFNGQQVTIILIVQSNKEQWFLAKSFTKLLKFVNCASAVERNVAQEHIKKFQDFENVIFEDSVSHDSQLSLLTLSSTNTSNVDDWKHIIQPASLFLNTAGIYELIHNSQLPTAREFRRWITEELLPKIQTNKFYDSNTVVGSVLDAMNTIAVPSNQINTVTTMNSLVTVDANVASTLTKLSSEMETMKNMLSANERLCHKIVNVFERESNNDCRIDRAQLCTTMEETNRERIATNLIIGGTQIREEYTQNDHKRRRDELNDLKQELRRQRTEIERLQKLMELKKSESSSVEQNVYSDANDSEGDVEIVDSNERESKRSLEQLIESNDTSRCYKRVRTEEFLNGNREQEDRSQLSFDVTPIPPVSGNEVENTDRNEDLRRHMLDPKYSVSDDTSWAPSSLWEHVALYKLEDEKDRILIRVVRGTRRYICRYDEHLANYRDATSNGKETRKLVQFKSFGKEWNRAQKLCDVRCASAVITWRSVFDYYPQYFYGLTTTQSKVVLRVLSANELRKKYHTSLVDCKHFDYNRANFVKSHPDVERSCETFRSLNIVDENDLMAKCFLGCERGCEKLIVALKNVAKKNETML